MSLFLHSPRRMLVTVLMFIGLAAGTTAALAPQAHAQKPDDPMGCYHGSWGVACPSPRG